MIDGDPAVRDSLAQIMRLDGHDVDTFDTGQAFLYALDAESLQGVVCEAELPDTTGFAVFRTLRSRGAHCPFALLVSGSRPHLVHLALEAGIRDVFRKPLVHRQLLRFAARR